MFLRILISSIFLSGCHQTKTNSANLDHFFTDSKRVKLTSSDWEYHSVLNMNGCTAFWVKNNKNVNLVITARHCMDYKVTEACQNGLFFNDASKLHKVAKCNRVVIAQNDSDIAMVEVNLLNPLPSGFQQISLRLSSYILAANSNLEMIGFPADSMMHGNIAKTFNCVNRSTDPNQNSTDKNHSADRAVMHNCTTWGGNSGGPILMAGTDIVFGIPATYRRDRDSNNPADSRTMDRSELAALDLIAYFVQYHKATLDAWGVDIYK